MLLAVLAWGGSASYIHQSCRRYAKGRRESKQVLDADALFATLDLANVGAVEPGLFSQLFLGPTAFLTQFPDSTADFTYHVFRHSELCQKQPIGLQTIDSARKNAGARTKS